MLVSTPTFCFSLARARRYGQEMLRLQAEHAALLEQQKLQVSVPFCFLFFLNVYLIFPVAPTAARGLYKTAGRI
jgi:hypothetical protein